MAPEPVVTLPADALFWTAMTFAVLGSALTRWAIRRDRRARITRQRDVQRRHRRQEQRYAELTARYVRETQAVAQEQVLVRTGRDIQVLTPAGLLFRSESIRPSVSRS